MIVEAVGVSASTMTGDKERAKRIEAAMSQAVLDCLAEGITDPVKQKERMMEYRAKARAAAFATTLTVE